MAVSVIENGMGIPVRRTARIYGRIEKWLSHLAHNQEFGGSTPSPATN